MKNIVKAGLISLSTLFGTQASANSADTVVGIIEAHGIDVASLQLDELRERDIIGKNHCFDRNNDGVADLHDGVLERGDNYKYTLAVVTPDDNMQVHRGLSREDAVLKAMESDHSTAFLIDRHQAKAGENGQLVGIYFVKDGQVVNVVRPLHQQPVGDFGTGKKDCESLKMP